MAAMARHAPRFEETAYPEADPPDDHDEHDDHDGPVPDDEMPDHDDAIHDDIEMPENSVAMKVTEGPFGPIEMGGMFSLVMIREQLPDDFQDLEWYDHSEGTIARELEADGIDVPG